MASVVDSRGVPLQLGPLLGKGGEGTVYALAAPADKAVKIYNKPLSNERAEKIQVMAALQSAALAALTAWPLDLVRDRASGQPIGLMMPLVPGKKNIHHLYGPKSRLQDFPRADWRFLVRASANIARAFAVVHESGCVIGDVNHGSVMIGQDATVSLIDCDSFQVSDHGRHFLCEVGIETFTPPELQGRPFRGVVRTPNFDHFGLAVLVFHLLFMGRHPFAGRYTGAGEMPIAQAIRESRFPYGANRKSAQMEPPPGVPALAYAGEAVAALFEAAFAARAAIDGRPDARAWISALGQLEGSARRCSINAGHWYPGHLALCPWCEMEMRGANPLFPFVTAVSSKQEIFDAEALWTEIQGLRQLGPAPAVAASRAQPSASAVASGKRLRRLRWSLTALWAGLCAAAVAALPSDDWGLGIIASLSILVPLVFLHRWRVVAPYDRRVSESRRRTEEAHQHWLARVSDQPFMTAVEQFRSCHEDLRSMPGRRAAALRALHADQRRLQLNRFLDQFKIEDAKIKSLGPGRKRLLESYGIETAADIEQSRVAAVPGFGPVRVDRLLSWRGDLERGFTFNPAQAIDRNDLAQLDQKLAAEERGLVAAVVNAHAHAITTHGQILATRQLMITDLSRRSGELEQAKADRAALGW